MCRIFVQSARTATAPCPPRLSHADAPPSHKSVQARTIALSSPLVQPAPRAFEVTTQVHPRAPAPAHTSTCTRSLSLSPAALSHQARQDGGEAAGGTKGKAPSAGDKGTPKVTPPP